MKRKGYSSSFWDSQNLDEVRGRILGMKPLPNIREVFSEVHREESRKKVMMGEDLVVPTIDQNSALLLKEFNTTAMITDIRREGRGVTTAENQAIPETPAGRSTTDLQIGSLQHVPMTKKAEATKSQLMKDLLPLNQFLSARNKLKLCKNCSHRTIQSTIPLEHDL